LLSSIALIIPSLAGGLVLLFVEGSKSGKILGFVCNLQKKDLGFLPADFCYFSFVLKSY